MAERIKVMQIIARMNVGGPAVIVAELMRGLDASKFEQVLVTGYCDVNEADYLEEIATDIKAIRIAGLGRSISLVTDLRAFIGLVVMIPLAGFVAAQTGKGRDFLTFAKEAKLEVRKVVWPTRKETNQTTLIVAIVTLIMALVLYVLDLGLLKLVSFLTGLGI